MPAPLAPVVVGAVVATATALWYLTAPGRTLSTAVVDVTAILTGSIKLNAAQSANAQIIAEQFTAAGLGWLVPAAVANAYAESRLDAAVDTGDGGKSVGLFQLHENGGGKGMTVAARQNPVLNTQRIIEEARATPIVGYRGRTNGQLARDFAQLVERCYECGTSAAGGTAQLDARQKLVAQLYGQTVADAST